ncbi:MAG: hypothetical protein JO270_23065 [Acidobacteriaceae bacterium]|nr:hypothetical protein [Acidobacteriaceae bacterium]
MKSLFDILRFGVSIPFWDEWDFVSAVRELSSGELSWGHALLLRNGEHQIFGQIALSLTEWDLSRMHLRAVMVWNWLLSLVFCALVTFILSCERPAKASLVCFGAGVSFFFLLNPADLQVLLWALPPVYLLLSLGFLLGVCLARSSWPVPTKIIGLAVLSLLASFTLGNGLLFWVALPCVLLLYEDFSRVRRSRVALLIYLLLFCAALVCYRLGAAYYARQTPPPASGSNVLDIALFFLAFTGNFVSLSASPQPVLVAQTIGAVIILLFFTGAAIALKLRRTRGDRRAVLVWTYFGVFWFATGVLASASRYTFGASYALDASRYVPAASFFLITALILGALALGDLKKALPRFVFAYSTLISMVAVILSVAAFCRFTQTRAAHELMAYSRYQELHGVIAADASGILQLAALHNIFPHEDFAEFKKDVRFLSNRHWLHPALWDERFLLGLGRQTPNPACGSVDSVQSTDASLQFTGWAYLPWRSQRAHGILIVAFQNGTDPQLLGVAFPTKARPDVASSLGTQEALWSGWQVEVPHEALHGRGTIVQAFSYDAETGRACELAGGRSVSTLSGSAQ